MVGQQQDNYGSTSGSSLSEGPFEAFTTTNELSSEGDNTSSAGVGPSSSLLNGGRTGEVKTYTSNSSQVRSAANSQHDSAESYQSSNRSNSDVKPWEHIPSLSMDARSLIDSVNGERGSSDGVGSLTNQRNKQKFRRKGRCEVVCIAGAAGLGKSCLVQSVQIEARQRGYFASSKFDQSKKTPFGPVLKLLSSLFKQVFSESNTDTAFHQLLKQYVRPAWPMLHKILGLPEFLLGSMNSLQMANASAQLNPGYNRSLRTDYRRRDSSPSSSHNSLFSIALGTQSSQDFLRAGSSTKSMRLMNTFLDVLRVFTQHKFICKYNYTPQTL